MPRLTLGKDWRWLRILAFCIGILAYTFAFGSSSPTPSYSFKRHLGEGSYGAVDLFANDNNDQDLIAVKIFKTARTAGVIDQSMVRELVCLVQAKDKKNLIQPRRKVTIHNLSSTHGNRDSVVLEYLPIALSEFICKKPYTLSFAAFQAIAKGIYQGLLQLHRLGFIHRDLKPSNILMSDEAVPSQVKLIDFGLSREFLSIVSSHSLSSENCGGTAGKRPSSPEVYTITHRPPEILLGRKDYGLEADFWALGVTLFNLATGKNLVTIKPFQNIASLPEAEQALHAIWHVCGTPGFENQHSALTDPHRYPHYHLEFPKCRPYSRDELRKINKIQGTDEELTLAFDLINDLLTVDPDQRHIKITELPLRYPWLQEQTSNEPPAPRPVARTVSPLNESLKYSAIQWLLRLSVHNNWHLYPLHTGAALFEHYLREHPAEQKTTNIRLAALASLMIAHAYYDGSPLVYVQIAHLSSLSSKEAVSVEAVAEILPWLLPHFARLPQLLHYPSPQGLRPNNAFGYFLEESSAYSRNERVLVNALLLALAHLPEASVPMTPRECVEGCVELARAVLNDSSPTLTPAGSAIKDALKRFFVIAKHRGTTSCMVKRYCEKRELGHLWQAVETYVHSN